MDVEPSSREYHKNLIESLQETIDKANGGRSRTKKVLITVILTMTNRIDVEHKLLTEKIGAVEAKRLTTIEL